ncbi:hypothetical protein B0H11DRAFT_2208625 [Mycena galericulata]|nr:hypothetical protein B0H11DRAFT_2208625 [Mycena galericulata]
MVKTMNCQFLRARLGNFKFARARTLKIGRARLPNSRGAEHAVRAKYIDGIKMSKSRAGIPKKACLRGGVKSLRGGNKYFEFMWTETDWNGAELAKNDDASSYTESSKDNQIMSDPKVRTKFQKIFEQKTQKMTALRRKRFPQSQKAWEILKSPDKSQIEADFPDPTYIEEAFPNRSDDHGTLRNLQQSDFSSECSPKSPGGLHIATPQYSVHTRELPAVPAAAEAVLLGLAFPQWMLPGVQLGANKKKRRNHCTVPRKGIRSV